MKSHDCVEPYITGYFFVNFDFSKVVITEKVKKSLKDNMFSPNEEGLKEINQILSSTCTNIDYDVGCEDNNYNVILRNIEFVNVDRGTCDVYRAYNALLESKANFILDSYTTTPDCKHVQFSKSFVVSADQNIDKYMCSDLENVDKLVIPCSFKCDFLFSYAESNKRCKKLLKLK